MSSCSLVYIGNKLETKGYTPTAIDVLTPRFQELGYDVTSASSKQRKLLRMLDMFYAVIKKSKQVDIVLIDTYSTAAFYYAYVIAQLCRLLGVKYIPILHGGNLSERMSRSPLMASALFKHSCVNVAVSGYLQEVLMRKGFAALIIENSINLKYYPFRIRERPRPRILWVRSFDRIYNPRMAIYVLERVRHVFPDATLTMVGPDKDGSMEECKTLCKALKLETHVMFAGRLDKSAWIKLSQSHDFFINTTHIDNQPVSVIEAMALGMLVVSTNVGGIPFLINNSKNGFLVEPDNADNMAEVIITNINDSHMKNAAISENARVTAAQYDWEVIKYKWQKLFKDRCNAT